MAIDYGDAHTGVALSDPTGLLAGTADTIHSRKKGFRKEGKYENGLYEHGTGNA